MFRRLRQFFEQGCGERPNAVVGHVDGFVAEGLGGKPIPDAEVVDVVRRGNLIANEGVIRFRRQVPGCSIPSRSGVDGKE